MKLKNDKGLKVINAIASTLLACAVLLMSLQVFLRFVLGQPQPWAEEINRYCFVWATYLGSVIAIAKGTHIRVTDLVDRLGPSWRGRADLLNRLASLGAFGGEVTGLSRSFPFRVAKIVFGSGLLVARDFSEGRADLNWR